MKRNHSGVRFKFPSIIRRLGEHKISTIGFFISFVIVLASVLAPWLGLHDPSDSDLSRRLLPAIWSEGGRKGFIFGTDYLGRDLLSRVIYGGRITLSAGLGSVFLAAFVGLIVGSFSLFSVHLDNLAMRIMDMFFAFPSMLLALAIMAILGSGLFNAVVAIAIVYTPMMARVVRGQMIQIKEQNFILAARALGAGKLRIMLHHAIINLLPTMIIYGSLLAGRSILTIASLSFLGLGAKPPLPEWGAMLSESRNLMLLGVWWGILLPGIAIFLTVLSLNMMGDSLRDYLDPRLN